ncbi:hypothetical protein GCM10008943_31680 [Paenochrobactrum glaciei]|uniref:Uncharacterized protein n=1 Tax=Paenochrobactrum glaciei TaxID=486407 RepID=A0ABN1GLN3_9HYPH
MWPDKIDDGFIILAVVTSVRGLKIFKKFSTYVSSDAAGALSGFRQNELY